MASLKHPAAKAAPRPVWANLDLTLWGALALLALFLLTQYGDVRRVPFINDDYIFLDKTRAWFAQKGLSRPREGRLLAGVSAGFARRYEINPLVARLLAIAGILVLSPLVYIAAWSLMPQDAGGMPSVTGSVKA